MGDYPTYNSRDYPTGLTEFVNTFPPQKRPAVQAAVREASFRIKAEEEWVDGQVRGMVDLPDVLYKYAPLGRLDQGFPTSLRATQPAALNDVMEANIRTSMESKIDRDEWYRLIAQSLRVIFGQDGLPDEELERRKDLYGDPRISTIIREYLSKFVGVVSFSANPLIPTMWAHYANNSGLVVGYKTSVMRELGIDVRRVLYLELAPVYYPTKDNIVRLEFINEARRQENTRDGKKGSGISMLGASADLLELRKEWRELAKALFVKGLTWRYEEEVRLLVDLTTTRAVDQPDAERWPIRLLDVPAEAVAEVYVGFNTPRDKIQQIEEAVDAGKGTWELKFTDSHAYRMQVTSTLRQRRRQLTDRGD